MKTIVVYRSKYGYTKKYAEWLAESLGCDIRENASLADIAGYDVIIFGSGIYAGRINGVKLIAKNIGKLAGKKLVLFTVGANVGRPEYLKEFWAKALNDTVREKVSCFYVQGGLNYSRLGRIDKFMMDMLKKMLLKKGELTDDEKGLLTVYETPIDFTDRKNLKEILEFLN